MTNPKAIVLQGDGINCEAETAFALELAGFDAVRLLTTDFLRSPGRLFDAQLIVLPGGFSFGDEIASGKVLALEMRGKSMDILHSYIDAGGLVVGICNGFQVLTQLGLLPFSQPDAPRVVTLTHNAGGRFINRWVELEVARAGSSPFFDALARIQLPVRHGEGRLWLRDDLDEGTRAAVIRQAALRYALDLNGSFDRIAALTNEAGNVLGLMPHPEAFVRWSQHPAWTEWRSGAPEPEGGLERGAGFGERVPDGLAILRNIRKAAGRAYTRTGGSA